MLMTSETIKLNLIPGGELPVLHASQFDEGRALSFEIYDGEELFPSYNAYDISLHVRKVDGTVIGIDTYNVDTENHLIIFFTTEQVTACAGKNIGELVFSDSDSGSVVGSCNFILDVEPDPYAGGIDSASDIENINTQIASLISTQLEDYYTKSEIDEQIETIVTEQVTPIVSGIVAEQVPEAVQQALGDDYYDKSAVDNLLSDKANASDTYTKTEVDALTGTWLSAILLTGNTSLTISDDSITTSSILDFYTDIYGVSPLTVTVSTGQIVMTFDIQSIDMNVKVKVI